MANRQVPKFCDLCNSNICPREHVLQCSKCCKYQHRKCMKDMTKEMYSSYKADPASFLCTVCANSPEKSVPESQTETASAKGSSERKRQASPRPSPDKSKRRKAAAARKKNQTEQTEACSEEDNSSPEREIAHLGTFSQESEQQESTLDSALLDSHLDAEVSALDQPEDEKAFELIESGSNRGGDVLVDRYGYRYAVKRKQKGAVVWQCTSRQKDNYCKATVRQVGDSFEHGPVTHSSHEAKAGGAMVAEIKKRIKSEALRDLFEPAQVIVEKVLLDTMKQPCPAMPALSSPIRSTNLVRGKERPEDPCDLTFFPDRRHLPPDFVVGNVSFKNRRHIILAFPVMMSLLARAKRWYLDGTFKIMKKPFYQLYSISVFIKTSPNAVKQVPVAFVVMSGRKKNDYDAVFKKIKESLHVEPAMTQAMMDFESAALRAFRVVFPEATIKGCCFHFSQAVWRKVQEVDLQVAYRSSNRVNRFCRRLMALAFLPAEHIQPAFQELRKQLESKPHQKLQELTDYFKDSWINSTVWPLPTWSVFGQYIRTNNDVEVGTQGLSGRRRKETFHFISSRNFWPKSRRMYPCL